MRPALKRKIWLWGCAAALLLVVLLILAFLLIPAFHQWPAVQTMKPACLLPIYESSETGLVSLGAPPSLGAGFLSPRYCSSSDGAPGWSTCRA